MIADLLPRYYEFYENNLRYDVIRSVMIEGHEVAWMSYVGTIQYDISGRGLEGTPFIGRVLMCECDFTEIVGWYIKDDRRFTTDAARKCLKRTVALEQRHLELREEYEARFGKGLDSLPSAKVAQVVLDLVDKAIAGEWLENGSGAAFYGGHFYFQTVASILDMPMAEVAETIYKMVARHEIKLDGAVVKSYSPPPPAEWEDCFTVELDGWTGKALLPAHSEMPQEWQFELLDPEGKKVVFNDPHLRLVHTPIFGPDVDDVAAAEHKLLSLIDDTRTNV